MVKKKTAKRRTSPKISAEVEKLILQNSVALQKALTNLAIKFDSMSGQIEKLLGLFEMSAKSLLEKKGSEISNEDRDFLNKLDQLIDQNKTIAKGLTLMDERIREKVQSGHMQPRINRM